MENGLYLEFFAIKDGVRYKGNTYPLVEFMNSLSEALGDKFAELVTLDQGLKEDAGGEN